MLIASLPMYDFPEVRDATDTLWAGISAHMKAEGIAGVPLHLTRGLPLHTLWSDRRLFFSQCCGFDIMHRYRRSLQVLATPCFLSPGCRGFDYASAIVVPEHSRYKDVIHMRGTVAVINGAESHSGMNALFGLVAPHAEDNKFFAKIEISGSHAESLAALRRGEADVASIDCHTYALLARYRPDALAGTRSLGLTYGAPAPPYVTRSDASPGIAGRMEKALSAAFSDPATARARDALLIGRVHILPSTAYRRISVDFRHGLSA